MIKSLIPVICPSVESSRSPSRRRGGSPTTVIITGVGGAWIWPGCSSWSERSSTFGPSLQAHLVAQSGRARGVGLPQDGHPHLRFGQRVLSSATPSVLGDFTHHSIKK